MAKTHTIETVDRSFRDIMDNSIPFGGKIMAFGGDFRQVLLVVPKSTRAETVDAGWKQRRNNNTRQFNTTASTNAGPTKWLVLKKNAPIMMLRNLDPSNGLCNGTRLICRGFDNNVIHAEITTGQFTTKQMFIPRIKLSPPENEGHPFKFIRKQFPIRLYFAVTINKAQGQIIPNVG
ncbi:uncharacterized protein LOC129884274 [Solanum dulcamara]|uniref:uncharacterized protein LOC129884274 n=1 Tax=Solanum dulcamara TaxID=45834 RepID=UPI0024868FE5|nr:uncharacterized protein LOC129884274 [Solanum dulcamara]